MLNRQSLIGSLLVLSALFCSGTAEAKVITYNIDVTVTEAPNAPGSDSSALWNTLDTPVTYSGTFTADDTIAGPIDNLNLTIGGLDISSVFVQWPTSPTKFDPATLQLDSWLTTWDGKHFVIIGDLQDAGIFPVNYVVALDESTSGPFDPYVTAFASSSQTYSQNWVGT